MKTIRTLTAAVAAFSMMAGQVWAAGLCVSSKETLALKTAALQQELMVAAFTCNDADAYNRFVLSYRPELRQSDAAMRAYFQRASAQTGEADYNSYKTSLANNFSLIQIRDTGFCDVADQAFGAALDTGHPALELIVTAQPFSVSEDEPMCSEQASTETVGGGSSAMATFLARRRN